MLQLEEADRGRQEDRRLVAKDRCGVRRVRLAGVMAASCARRRRTVDLNESPPCCVSAVASASTTLRPQWLRLLHKIPACQDVSDHVVGRFANLQKIMRAGLADLTEVDGVGEVRARAIKEGLSRLAETSILERYV
jgi:diadenylate cyclase